MKHAPLYLSAAAIIATQIACTYALMNREPDEVFVDHIRQIVYDGEVVRADLGRGWASEDGEPGSTESRVVGRLILTRDATLTLHRQLADLLSVAREPGREL